MEKKTQLTAFCLKIILRNIPNTKIYLFILRMPIFIYITKTELIGYLSPKKISMNFFLISL